MNSPAPSPAALIELVIFDCDGVLVDSELVSARVLIEQLAKEGIEIDFSYVRQHFLGRSFATVESGIRDSFDYQLPAEFEQRYRENLMAAFRTELRLVDGIEDVLNGLAVQACVATSSSDQRARQTLKLAGLLHRFHDRTFTASQVPRGKPAPDLFLHAAASMGVSPEYCLVIEDSIPGVQAARAAGMQVWRFAGASHMLKQTGATDPTDLEVTVFDKWSDFFDMAPQLKSTSISV